MHKLTNRCTMRTMMAALCCMMMSFAACTKEIPDDIDTITVNTAAIYEELGIEDEMSQALADGICTISDTLLIYNQSGQLVMKLGATSSELQPLTLNAEGLADGTYTLVLWQAGTSSEAAWVLSDKENLSTVKLTAPTTPMDFSLSAGCASATVMVKKGVVGADLTPKAIGSVIDMQAEELATASSLSNFSLYDAQPQHYIGIYLNPALGEDGRWITESQSGARSSVCTVERDTPNGKFFTLSHGEDMEFQLWGVWNQQEDSLGVISHKTFGAGEHLVCYYNIDRFYWQPPFMGSPETFYVWKADRDAGHIVTEPYLHWGASIAEVQQHINAKNWWIEGNPDFEYWEEPYHSWHKWYYVAPYLTEQYLYETQDGQNLRYVVCYCWYPDAPAETRDELLLRLGFQSTGETVEFDGYTYDRFLSADGVTEALTQFIPEPGFMNCWETLFRPVNNRK